MNIRLLVFFLITISVNIFGQPKLNANQNTPPVAELVEVQGAGGPYSVNDIINKIKTEVGMDWLKETRDNVVAGDPNTKVTGIVTTFMSTLAVLQKAKAMGCNFVITHEPTFYTHTDDLKTHEKDPVQIAKLKFINDNKMVVWRFHDHQHRMPSGDQIYQGVVEKMGWKKCATSDKTLLNIPPKSLGEIVKILQKNMGAKTARIVGKPNMMVTKVGLALGAAGTNTHTLWLQKLETARRLGVWPILPHLLPD